MCCIKKNNSNYTSSFSKTEKIKIVGSIEITFMIVVNILKSYFYDCCPYTILTC